MFKRGIPKEPKIYIYKEYNKGKKTVRTYELKEVVNVSELLSTKLHLSVNRGFAKSSPLYWLKKREGNKWSKQIMTGLFKSKYYNIYYGDLDRKKHLIVFKFSEDFEQLTLFVFKDLYTADLTKVFKFIK